MPPVTVLMSVCNGERYLQQAIHSILDQTYTDFEFLIVDDGSSDASREIVLSFRDSRIRLLQNPTNIGLSRSLNRGIREARGQFIARQDADDISESHRLATQLAFLKQHPDVALLGSWFAEIDEYGAMLARKQLPCDSISIRWMLLFVSAFVHASVIIRRDALAAVGAYDESLVYAMDYDLWKRIARQFPIANLAQILVRYRRHPGAMSATIPAYRSEADDLSFDGLATALGWTNLRTGSRSRRFQYMSALLYADAPSIPPSALPRTCLDIWRLHNAFCRRHRLQRSTSITRRQQLFRYLVYRTLFSLRTLAVQGAGMRDEHPRPLSEAASSTYLNDQ